MDFIEILLLILVVHGVLFIGMIYLVVANLSKNKKINIMKKDLYWMGNHLDRLSKRIKDLEDKPPLVVRETNNDFTGSEETEVANSFVSDESASTEEISQEVPETIVQKVANTEPVKVDPLPIAEPYIETDKTVESVESKKETTDVLKVFMDQLTVESIISKLGIFLLLLGTGYLFTWAYENEHPVVAMNIGFAIGVILLVLAIRVEKKKRGALSQVLYGGSIAVFYTVIYTIYDGFTLLPGLIAFVLMTANTVFAFMLAITRKTPSLAIIGIIGGLLTPFIVPVESFGLMGTGVYLVLLTLGAATIYYVRGWRTLHISTISGLLVVTWSLMTFDFTSTEKLQFSVLLIILLIINNGVDYLRFYKGYLGIKYKWISYILFGVLPMVTAIQIESLLALEGVARFVTYMIVSAIFVAITWFFFLNEEKVVASITVTLASGYIFYGVTAYFKEQAILLILFFMMAMMYLVARQVAFRYIRILGHIIGSFTMWVTIALLMANLSEMEMSVGSLVEHLGILIIIIAGSLFNHGKTKKVLLSISILGYGLIFILVTGLIWIPLDNDMGIIMLVFTAFMVAVALLQKRFSWFFDTMVIIYTMFPVVLKLISVVNHLDVTIIWWVVLLFVIYAAFMYVLGYMEDRKLYIFTAYGLIIVTVLFEVSSGLKQMAFGVLLYIAIIYVLKYLEPKREDAAFGHFTRINVQIWLVVVGLYALFANIAMDFNPMLLLLDAIILGFVYYESRGYQKGIWTYLVLAVWSLMMMLMTYKDIIDLSGTAGAITVVWIVFGIGLLIIGVIRAKKAWVRFAIWFMLVVFAKLILIDMSNLDAIWKVVISMSLGGLLLFISYVLQPLMDKRKLDS